MAKPWSAVASSQEYQSLPPDQQESARQQYFSSVVAPQVTQDQLSTAKTQFDASTAKPVQSAQPQAQQPQSFVDQVKQNLGNEVAGLARGAGSIGATLLTPYDLAVGNTQSIANPERRQAMDVGLTTLGADPNAGFFKAGKIVSEIAGTAGAGGALANTAKAAGAPEAIVSALGSGGLKLSTPAATTAFSNGMQWLARIGGGAVTGGTQAGLVNPDQAKAGAVIGGALPVGIKAAGMAGDALKNGASWFMAHALGSTTGTSPETISAAFQAGKKGLTEFLDNMRGKADFGDVVDSAKQGLANMRDARAQAYRSGMVDIKSDQSVLDFSGVDKALNDVVSTGSYKGVPIRQKAAETVDDIKNVVDQWRGLDPAQYHTPEGFDALKQSIGDIRDSTQYGTPARRAADAVYNAVKTEINQQAPTYAAVMKDYADSTKAINEIQGTFSLGEKGSKDTAIRKLQSLLRNNVQSNYGNRLNLADQLQTEGGVSLTPAIAGQAMSSWLPRGMTGVVEKAGIPGAALLTHNPLMLAAGIPASPRLMGEGAYALGKAAGGVGSAASSGIDYINALLGSQSTDPQLLNALLRTPTVLNLQSQAVRQ